MFYYLTSDWEDRALANYMIVLLTENFTLRLFCAGVDVTS